MKLRQEHKEAQKKEPWHTKEASEVLKSFDTQDAGLSSTEAKARIQQYGENVFTEAHRENFFERLFRQCKSPLVIVLLIAGVVTFLLHEFVDTAVILFALCIAIVVGMIQEGRASRAFERLAKSQLHIATVIRDGGRHEIRAEEVVPGDIVLLQSGMQVPADLRLIEAKKLAINEATLTGEWAAVDKNIGAVPTGTPLAEQSNMAWKGTFVADGHGIGVAIATGDQTEVGKLAEELGSIREETTPLQHEMKRISRTMFTIIVVLVVLIFAIGIIRGEDLESMLIMSIAIAVASVPEGLPAAVTIILAVGMEALLRKGGLVRSLLAAETLGSTTYILTDKTGTLTEGRMALSGVVTAHEEKEYTPTDPNWNENTIVRTTLNTAMCASDAYVEEERTEEGGKETYIVRGEPMERAILEAGLGVGITLQGESFRAQRVDYLSFTSENRFAAGLARDKRTYRMCVNGAPEYILEASTHVFSERTTKMSVARRKFFLEEIDRFTKQGKRIIAVAYRTGSNAELPEDPKDIMERLIFMGLLVFDDPVRTDVHASIEEVQRAGAEIRLVTGDNAETALSVARSVGIADAHDTTALTGSDIHDLTDEELRQTLNKVYVFARVLPREKLRLARVLQEQGEVVAMTGDGINDAPALQKANIGIALGSSTEVAKEASELVLVNDTFTTIRFAIAEGRRIIDNLQKIVGYLLSTSLTEATLIGCALLVGAPLPILPVQILWANMIEEGLMSVAFAFEPGDKNAMREHPHDIRKEGILSRELLIFIGLVVLILGILVLALYAFLLYLELPIEEVRSVMFLAIAIDSLFIAFSFRSLKTPIWKIPFSTNKFFLASFAVSSFFLGIVLTVPFFQRLLSYEPIPLFDIMLIVVYGFLSMIVIEAAKWFFFERKRAA